MTKQKSCLVFLCLILCTKHSLYPESTIKSKYHVGLMEYSPAYKIYSKLLIQDLKNVINSRKVNDYDANRSH